MEDACMAYIRAVEASESISGIFNVASGNHTVGEVADLVRNTIEQELSTKLALEINHIKDIRNYKVSIERARNVLSFHPHHNIRWITCNLIENLAGFRDWDDLKYYNIQVFKALETQNQPKPVGAGDNG